VKATVVLFAYNHEAFIEEALLSALGQTSQAHELLIVDDASTDGTRAVIDQVLGREAPRGMTIRKHYRPTNGGLLQAVNEAFALATGDIIMVMAGDDISMPDRLASTLKAFAADPDVMLVFGGYLRVDEQGRPLRTFSQPEKAVSYAYAGAPVTRIYGRSSPFGASAAYRRKLFEVFGPMQKGTHGEDNCYWVRAMLLGEIRREPAVFVHWRQHASNLSNFTVDQHCPRWRARHLSWMECHANMSPQWLADIDHARSIKAISLLRAWRLTLAAGREDRTWALGASTLREVSWSVWLRHAVRLLAYGRTSTVFRMFKMKVSSRRREHEWHFWAKLKSNQPI
jgi:glycosyltransferase involved in cell wall biosynthesis